MGGHLVGPPRWTSKVTFPGLEESPLQGTPPSRFGTAPFCGATLGGKVRTWEAGLADLQYHTWKGTFSDLSAGGRVGVGLQVPFPHLPGSPPGCPARAVAQIRPST